MKILLFGASGWIGGKLLVILEKIGEKVIVAKSRLDNYKDVVDEVNLVKPTHVLNCAALTGRPNIDWCEDHKDEVLRVNVIGTAVLAETCARSNIHFTFVSSGCLYNYNDEHPIPTNSSDWKTIKGYTEDDEPNFTGSFYSCTKVVIEKIIKSLPKALILRVRMPISDDLHDRNFIKKLTTYEHVINIPNSVSTLYDLLPIIPDMMIKEKSGIYNFTNPGVITHNEILKLYKEMIDPKFTWKNFSLEDQSKVLKAPRSNNYLDASKLSSEYPEIPEIHVAIQGVFERMKKLNK